MAVDALRPGSRSAPGRVRRRRARAALLRYSGLVAFALIFLVPLLFMVVGAFKPGELVLAESSSWRALRPTGASMDNFATAIQRGQFLLLLRNSAVISVATVALGLLVNSLLGYAMARLTFPGRRLLITLVISLTIVPFQAVAIPLLYMISGWGWRDTLHVQVMPFIASPLSAYLFYTAFLSIPRELEEAARVDGAGPLTTFLRIVVPNAKPAFATVATLTFLSSWGELLWPVLTTSDIAVRPLPLGLSLFRGQMPIDQGVIMAFALLMATPMLVLFVVFQRGFERSIAASGIKG